LLNPRFNAIYIGMSGLFHRAFTLIEILIVLAVIGVLSAMVMPNLYDLTKRGNGMKCTQNLRMIQMAKSNYAIEFAGDGSPDYLSVDADDVLRVETFQSYFPEGFIGVSDTCPATGITYSLDTVYDIYTEVTCSANAPDGADLAAYPEEINVPPYSRNGYHDLGRRN